MSGQYGIEIQRLKGALGWADESMRAEPRVVVWFCGPRGRRSVSCILQGDGYSVASAENQAWDCLCDFFSLLVFLHVARCEEHGMICGIWGVRGVCVCMCREENRREIEAM